jgi:hypothetical protein
MVWINVILQLGHGAVEDGDGEVGEEPTSSATPPPW